MTAADDAPVTLDLAALAYHNPAGASSNGSSTGNAGGADTVATCYPTMASWFREWFHQVIQRQQTQSLIWCPQWWQHNEALAILDGLWMAWEGARISPDPDAMLTWWERATGMLNHLTSRDVGPFAACTREEHRDIDLSLPYDREPLGFFGIVFDDESAP